MNEDRARRAMPLASELLVIGTIVYIVLLVAYFRTESTALKYVTTWLGILLLPLAPEVTKSLRTMALVMAPLAAGVAAVQINDDIAKENAAQAERIQKALNLDVQEAERKLRDKEKLFIHPRDAAAALRHAPSKLALKADRLRLSAALAESKLLRAQAQLATAILAMPDDPEAALQAYRALAAKLGAGAAEKVNGVIGPLAQAVAYRALAREITTDAVPVYDSVVSDIDNRRIDVPAAQKRLAEVEEKLTARITAYPIAGLFTHLGVLAMAQGSRNRAMARYYASVAVDKDHIPGYEAVAYGAWALNMDTRTAITYAEQGMALAEAFPGQVDQEYQEIVANYAAVAADNPSSMASLGARKSQIEQRAKALRGAFDEGTGVVDNLQLIFAYCSALELMNQDRAKALSRRLYDSDKNDGDYQDALGLVLLMFARDKGELDEAEGLFKSAFGNSKSEEMTRQLARMHTDKLAEKRAKLGLHR